MDFLNKMQKPLLSMYTYTVYICMAICSLLCSCLNCEQRVVWREFFSLRAQWRVEPLFGWLGCCHFTVGPNLKNPQKIRLTKFVKLTLLTLFLQQFDKLWIRAACNDRKRKLVEFAGINFGGTYFRWVLAIWNHCALLSRQRAPNAAFYDTHSGHSADFFFFLFIIYKIFFCLTQCRFCFHYLQKLFLLSLKW